MQRFLHWALAHFRSVGIGGVNEVDAELVEADPENWLISDAKLYVFGKPVGPDLFPAKAVPPIPC
jgi:hypothetical protein